MKPPITISTTSELRKLKNGKYSIRFKIPPHDNIKKWTWTKWYKTNATSKGQARRKGETFRLQAQEELNDHTLKENITVGEYAEQWCEDRKLFNIVKPSTYARDQIEINIIKESYIGNIKLDYLSEEDIEEFKRENIKKGYSGDKQTKLLKKVKQIVRDAAKKRKIKRDVGYSIENIKYKSENERRSLPRKKQIQLLNDLEAEEPNGKIVVIRIAFSTGMRRGEILGLEWRDIDFKTNVIHLRRQLTAKGEKEDPKYHSIGDIPMDQDLKKYLEKWQKITKTKWYKGKKLPLKSPVCRNDNGEQLQAANFDKFRRQYFVDHGLGEFTKEYTTYDKKGYIRYHKTGYKGYNLHELRHTLASELVSSVDIKTAQTILRHTQIRTTEKYVHEIPENIKQAMEKVNKDRRQL